MTMEESTNRLIQSLQSRVRTLEEELRISRAETNFYKGRMEALNILLQGEIDGLEEKIKQLNK